VTAQYLCRVNTILMTSNVLPLYVAPSSKQDSNDDKYFRHFENSNEKRPLKYLTKALNSDLSDVSAFR